MNLSNSGIRNKAYLIIISAFVLGIVTGGLLMNILVARSSAIKRGTSSMDNMATELQLDQNQRSRIEKIFMESRQRSKDLVKGVQPQLDELHGLTREKVKEVLRPDQLSRYEKWSQKRQGEKEKTEKQ